MVIGVCEASEQCDWSSLKWWRTYTHTHTYTISTHTLGPSGTMGRVKMVPPISISQVDRKTVFCNWSRTNFSWVGAKRGHRCQLPPAPPWFMAPWSDSWWSEPLFVLKDCPYISSSAEFSLLSFTSLGWPLYSTCPFKPAVNRCPEPLVNLYPPFWQSYPQKWRFEDPKRTKQLWTASNVSWLPHWITLHLSFLQIRYFPY